MTSTPIPQFTIKQGSRRPALRVKLTHGGDNTAIDLSGLTVLFYMRLHTGGALKVNGAACTLVDATNGVVEYQWAAGDVDTAGSYHAEFEVDFTGGVKGRWPSGGYILVTIEPQLT